MRTLVMLFVLFALLTGCASQRDDYRLDVGKRSFMSGDYKNAFHALLPLAMQGNTHAEYAVGYMYYYGFGVPQDNESGLMWMERAAKQGSPAATDALRLIHTKPTTRPPAANTLSY